MERLVIGRKDHVNLPLFGLKKVPVKVDTGAYTSSIHCDHVDKIIDGEKEVLRVEFFAWDNRPAPIVIFEDFQEKRVKSSSGHEEARYIVKGTIELFGKVIQTPFSLTERQEMRYPILLGRKLLNKRFIVDPSKTNLSALGRKTSVYIR